MSSWSFSSGQHYFIIQSETYHSILREINYISSLPWSILRRFARRIILALRLCWQALLQNASKSRLYALQWSPVRGITASMQLQSIIFLPIVDFYYFEHMSVSHISTFVWNSTISYDTILILIRPTFAFSLHSRSRQYCQVCSCCIIEIIHFSFLSYSQLCVSPAWWQTLLHNCKFLNAQLNPA